MLIYSSWICLIFMFLGRNCLQFLNLITTENGILLKHSHLIICFYLNKALIKKVHLWMWLIKCSVTNNLLNPETLMMRNWYANSFLMIFYKHLINFYLHTTQSLKIKTAIFILFDKGQCLLRQIFKYIFSFFIINFYQVS